MNRIFVKIETLKKGDVFFFPNRSIPYVFNGYNRTTKKYSYHKYYDISAFYEKPKGTMVDLDADF